MSVEAIEEYLAIAKHCVSTRKSNGALYGYPAVLLLCCIIDALGNYGGHAKNTLRGARFIVPDLTDKHIKHLKNWYPAHQAIIMPGTKLSDDPIGSAIEFDRNGEPTHIRVIPFYRAVKSGWDFDKTMINPRFELDQAPRTPIPTTNSPLSGDSDYYVTSAKPTTK